MATSVKILDGIEICCLAEFMDVLLNCLQLELSRVLNKVEQLVGLGILIHEDMVHAILDAVCPDGVLVGLKVNCWVGVVTVLKTIELDASVGSTSLLHLNVGF